MSDPLDVARYIFINDESELRSGWRLLVFFVLLILAGLLLTGLTKAFATLFPSLDFLLVEPSGSDDLTSRRLIYLGVSNATNLAAAAIASAVCARALERRSVGSVGFRLHRGWSRDFGLGSLMGAASLAIAVGIAAATGAISFHVQTRNGDQIASGFIIVFLIFLIAAAREELIFRGFPFQALVHNLSGARAVAITSVIFGLAHLWNPSASAFSTINTILAGVWLGLAYLMTRSLWLATALHYSWNFAMVFIFGLPVSGLTTFNDVAWLRGSIGTPLWISGGGYGPEAGVAATVALILSTLAIWKSGLFTPSEEMLSAIKHGKPEPAFVSITPENQTPVQSASDRQQSEEESNPSPS
ncbi:MAG: CPBP family intramembrane glutamic endopeptidase [Acidobacteriota bacterium]